MKIFLYLCPKRSLRRSLDRPPSLILPEENHALDVVVLQQVDVGAHVGDGPYVDDDHIVDLGELLLVEPALQRHGGLKVGNSLAIWKAFSKNTKQQRLLTTWEGVRSTTLLGKETCKRNRYILSYVAQIKNISLSCLPLENL